MDWKGLYTRFRKWQINPFEYQPYGDENHQCCNCGTKFQGNYCPLCSQRSDQHAVNWESVRSGVMEIWGIGSRSMPYSLWQLLWRPGYFISDYVNGKRQISFPPVKMLIIVSVIVTLINQWIDPESVITTNDFPENYPLKESIIWLLNHWGWGLLIWNSFLILPTYLIFHYSPRNTAHTLPAGFFIQVFISTMILIFIIINVYVATLIFIYFFITYRQLFGYGIWGTIWRLALCFFDGALLVGLAIVFFLYFTGKSDVTLRGIAIISLIVLGFIAVSYLFNRIISQRKTVTATPTQQETTESQSVETPA